MQLLRKYPIGEAVHRNSFQTRSTHKGDIVLEICSACYPFFTGKQKLVDTAGRKFAASGLRRA